MQRVGSSLRSLSPSLRSHRTQKRKTGESNRETALTFGSLTLSLISTTSQWGQKHVGWFLCLSLRLSGGNQGASRWSVGEADGEWILDRRGDNFVFSSVLLLLISSSWLSSMAWSWSLLCLCIVVVVISRMNLGLAGMEFVHLSSLYFTKFKFCMLVGTVESRQADLSMNLALTGAREKVIDYSAPYIGSCLPLCLCVWRSSGTTLLPIKNRPLLLY